MNRRDFYFDLPDALIARYPLAERSASRLLCLSGSDGNVVHRQFRELPELIAPGDLLVFNQSRVMPARLFAQKISGGQVEILIERLPSATTALAHLRASKSPKPGSELILSDGTLVRMTARADALFVLEADEPWAGIMARAGEMPLPPYFQREAEASDNERYQTVYARDEGSVAAPTAGLHFDAGVLAGLKARGIETAFVTLHVGAGTFQPVRSDQLEDHIMHAEWLTVSNEVIAAVQAARARGGRVIAVGTTSVRALESMAWASRGIDPEQWRVGQSQQSATQPQSASAQLTIDKTTIAQQLKSFAGDTRLFITPGYDWQVIDAMVTNFHLPESTLLMLVSAMAGREAVLSAYAEAIAQNYRFFSYGDAMWVTGPDWHEQKAELPITRENS
ncbi:MAG: tRNA preQ1(34) S-adenosylmethionine ribosyltransferase-isomerase QueA [Paraperlucidibaca sp.]|nr:tRNA preQ1(34) S-adenosylmethionine ribosyltransferase-isomerase QueA [Paraperlucidibaca sp.]MBQ0722587.1 tRNA preQ1(34) S-adenosylmethionine ribosyltransferase-isomerase QueA [Paraperlucidibaca sp.]MBQ0842039.1 tRNA preQ1(34) S-adenosylmethionine ribosyltransferase-isomerase QueA [Paraperlucidibaca sp.]